MKFEIIRKNISDADIGIVITLHDGIQDISQYYRNICDVPTEYDKLDVIDYGLEQLCISNESIIEYRLDNVKITKRYPRLITVMHETLWRIEWE